MKYLWVLFICVVTKSLVAAESRLIIPSNHPYQEEYNSPSGGFLDDELTSLIDALIYYQNLATVNFKSAGLDDDKDNDDVEEIAQSPHSIFPTIT